MTDDDASADNRGPRSLGAGMRLGSLKARHRKEYAELAAEARGLSELP